MKAKIFYVEDDESLSFVTRDNLALQGYEIIHFSDGEEALAHVSQADYDLCILDVMLPGADGFMIAKEIRRFNQEVPIIFLTAKSLKEDKIHGLKLGGDDYLTKPFSIEELILKIEIFLRRSKFSAPAAAEKFTLGNFVFDYKNLSLTYNGEEKILTQREADLLNFLCVNSGEIVKRSDILLQVWGDDDYFLGRSLDVFISRLRKYLKPEANVNIENIHGVGFRLKL